MKRGQEYDERRRCFSSRDLLELLGDASANRDGQRRASQRLLGRARAIRRKVEMYTGGGELLSPVLPEPFPLGSTQGFALPSRVVRVRTRRSAQPRWCATNGLCVEQSEFLIQQKQRPAVDGNVMECDEQDVVLVSAREQGCAEHRALFEIERPMKVGQDGVTELFFGTTRKIPHVECGDRVPGDMLNGRSVDKPVGRPQDGVPIDDCLNGMTQARHVDRAENARREREVIGRAVRRLLMQEPERLLAEREWKCVVLRRGIGAQPSENVGASRRNVRPLLWRERALWRAKPQAVAFKP